MPLVHLSSSCQMRCFWSWVHCFIFVKLKSTEGLLCVCLCVCVLQEERLMTGFLCLERKMHQWTEVCSNTLGQFALVLCEVPCSIQMTTAHSPCGETRSARSMKLPRAVWRLVCHWSFNNMIQGFVNKGLQTNAEFCGKPVEGAEGLEDLLERSAGVCVSKQNMQ